MIPTRFRNLEEARRRFAPSMVETFSAGLNETDPVGDAIAEVCANLPGDAGMRAVQAWLEGADQPYDELTELLAPLAEVPSWVDWERVERGNRAMWRGGLLTGLSFNCASLAAGYRSGAANKPLTFTGRLLYMAPRRTQETGRWFLAATGPDGMRRDSPGFKETVRVRIIHGYVRRRILKTGRWKAQEWGAPINLTDTAFGIAGEFSTVPVRAMQKAGIVFNQRERDDIQHLWRYIGHLIGVPDTMLAANEHEALQIVDLKELTDSPADDDSRALVKALIENGTPPEMLLPGPVAKRFGAIVPKFLYGLTRHWAGPEVAAELGLPDSAFKYAIPAIRPLVRVAEAARVAGLRDGNKIAERTWASASEFLREGPTLVSFSDAGSKVPVHAVA